MECGELLYGKNLLHKLNGTVYKSYLWPAMLYGSEAWCLIESEIGVLQNAERSMVRAMCGVQLKDRNWSKDLTSMFCFSETMDHFSMASSAHWYGQVLRREDVHVYGKGVGVLC